MKNVKKFQNLFCVSTHLIKEVKSVSVVFSNIDILGDKKMDFFPFQNLEANPIKPFF